VPAIRGRPKDRQQSRILVKGTCLPAFRRQIHDSVEKLEREYRKRRIKFVVDMDPIENG
jgi:hypothetical protein